MSGKTGITAKQEDALKEAFDKIDKDGSGELDGDEIRDFLKSVGMEEDYDQLIVKVFDKDGNKSISFDEFKEYIAVMTDLENDPGKLFRKLFSKIDKDGNNQLDAEEMVEFCKYLHVEMTVEEAKEVIDEIDSDSNGTIDFDELCKALGIPAN